MTKKLDAKKIATIKAKLASVKNPEKKAALKAQLKAAKKVADLRKALFKAPHAKKAAIKAKLEAAKAKLARKSAAVFRISKRLDAKKISAIQSKLAKVKNPEVKAALKAQLNAAKLVADLRKQLRAAQSGQKAEIKA